MSLWLREKRDGRRAPGYLVYLAGGLLAVAGVLYLHRGGAPLAPPSRRRPGSVGAVTRPAAMMAPVPGATPAPGPGAVSFRLAPAVEAKAEPGPAVPAESFDAIHAALSAAPDPAPGQSEPAQVREDEASGPDASPSPAYARLAPAFAPGSERAGSEAGKAAHGQLLGYRDESADTVPAEGPPAPEGEARPPPALLPRGTLLYVYLLTTVDSSNPAAVIQFGLARAAVFNRRRLLPFGTRLLGRIAGRPARDRLNLTADTVLFPDGREWPISATAVEADTLGANIRPGLAAEYFPPPPWARMAPYVSDLFTGFMGLLQSRAQGPLALGIGGLSVQTGGAEAVRAPLYQASGQAIQDYTQGRLREIEQRYASYYLIPAGTDCWLQVESDLALAAAPSARPAPALPLSPAAAPHAPEVSP